MLATRYSYKSNRRLRIARNWLKETPPAHFPHYLDAPLIYLLPAYKCTRRNFNILTGDVKTLTRLIPRLPGLSDTKWSEGSPFCTCRLCVQSKLPTNASVRWWNLPDTAFKLALCLELKLYRRKLNVGKMSRVTRRVYCFDCNTSTSSRSALDPI